MLKLRTILTVISLCWTWIDCAEEVETVVDTAELVLDVVEKVAEEVVEIADILEEKLPEGGKMKDAIERVESVAREIAKDADLLEDLLQKV